MGKEYRGLCELRAGHQAGKLELEVAQVEVYPLFKAIEAGKIEQEPLFYRCHGQ